MPKKIQAEVPIEFCWGTFCKDVLSKNNERSLYSVSPSLRVELSLGGEPPEQIAFPIHPLGLFVVFRRRRGAGGLISEAIELERIGFEGEMIEKPEITVRLEPLETHSQQVFDFSGAMLSVSSAPGIYEQEYGIIFKIGNNELGRVELPIVTVVKRA